ncbi:hypothetical protein D3C77_483770 [compost metagenome]
MRKGHLLFAEQAYQLVGFVAPGVHLLDTQRRCDIRHAPGVYMEHRRDGHVHIAGTQQRLGTTGRQRPQFIEGVQHQLAVGEVDALGVARRAGGVEQGCQRIFVKVREFVRRSRRSQQRFVLAQYR